MRKVNENTARIIDAFREGIKLAKSGEITVTVKEHTRNVGGVEYTIQEHERIIRGGKSLQELVRSKSKTGVASMSKAQKRRLISAIVKNIDDYDRREVRRQAIAATRNSAELILSGEGIPLTREGIEARLVEEINRVFAAADIRVNINKDGTRVAVDFDKISDINYEVGRIEDFDGVRGIFTITDHLGVGDKVDKHTGQEIQDLHGGIGFGWQELHKDFAWASIGEVDAKKMASDALRTYLDHKEEFPDGEVPLFVMKMGLDSIDSNEAMYRVLGERMRTFLDHGQRAGAYQYLVERATSSVQAKNFSPEALKLISEAAETDDPILHVVDNITDIPASNRKPIGDSLFTGKTENREKRSPSNRNAGMFPYVYPEGTEFPRDEAAMFTRWSVAEVIREKALDDVPARHIVAVNYVKVTDEDGNVLGVDEMVMPTSHPNYAWGVKGRAGVILEETAHLSSLLPQAYSNQAFYATTKPVETEGMMVAQAISTTTTPVTTAFSGKQLTLEPSENRLLAAYMNLAFPRTSIVDNREEWHELINDDGFNVFKYDGSPIYGVVEKDGVIYMNPDIPSIDVPVYGMAHVWIDHIENANNELYEKGISMIKETETYAVKLKRYSKMDVLPSVAEKKAAEEALAMSIASKMSIITSASKRSGGEQWMRNLSLYMREVYPAHFSSDDSWMDDDINFNDFLDGAVGEIFTGQPIYEKNLKELRVGYTKEEKEGIRSLFSAFPDLELNDISNEMDRIKLLDVEDEYGQTFNVNGDLWDKGGLVIPLASDSSNVTKVSKSEFDDFVKDNNDKVVSDNIAVGVYKFPKSNKVSYDLNLVIEPDKLDIAKDIAKYLGQESIFNIDTFENIKTGGTGEDTVSLSPEQLKETVAAINKGKVPDFMMSSGEILSAERRKKKDKKEA